MSGGVGGGPSNALSASGDSGVSRASAGLWKFTDTASAKYAEVGNGGVNLQAAGLVGWSASTDATAAAETWLARASLGTVEVYNTPGGAANVGDIICGSFRAFDAANAEKSRLGGQTGTLSFSSACVAQWCSGSAVGSGSNDIGLGRNGAGILAVTNGSGAAGNGSIVAASAGLGGATAGYVLNVTGTAHHSSTTLLGGVTTFDTGIGAVPQLVGPSDQNWQFNSQNNRSTYFTSGSTGTGTGDFELYSNSTVTGSARYNMIVYDGRSIAAGIGGGIAFGADVGGGGAWVGGSIIGCINAVRENATVGNYKGSIIFSTAVAGGTETEGMRLNSAQQLLIGATAPIASELLYVAGAVQASGSLSLSATSNQLVLHSASNAGTVTWVPTSARTITFPDNTGLAAVPQAGRVTAQTASASSVAAITVGAADATYLVSANVLVTTSTAHSFTVTVAYTDEGNTARTLTLPFSQLAGTITANVTGAGPYEGIPLHIRCKAATTITIATTGTFTTVTYNVEGLITQAA